MVPALSCYIVDGSPSPVPENGQTPDPILPVSEAEADDELESDVIARRSKPATQRNQIRQTFEDTIHKRNHFPRERAERLDLVWFCFKTISFREINGRRCLQTFRRPFFELFSKEN